MRVLVAIWIALLVTTANAAPNYELNRIRGTIDQAESRLKDNALPNARHFVDSAKDDLAKASAETRRDPEYPRLQQRLARIEAELARRETSAGKSQAADDKLREAESAKQFARLDLGQDNYDKAKTGFEKCLSLIAEAKAIDPSVMSRRAGGGPETGVELEKVCREGAAKKHSQTPAAQTEEAQAAMAGYAAAVKASETKKRLTAEVLVAGIKGADECRNKMSPIRGLTLRNGRPAYDPEKEMLPTVKGSISMAQMDKHCAKLQLELKNKKATGCGRSLVLVRQNLLPGPRWSAVEHSGSNVQYEMIKCSEMPRASKFPGKSAGFKRLYLKTCGAGATYVINDRTWNDTGMSRNMAGFCYRKGQLRFYK